MTAAAADDEPIATAPTPGSALVAVPVERASITEKITYAQHLAQSGLLPRSYQRNPANVLFAVEYGAMLGLPPMAAINGIHVIEGKPTASSALMSALVRRAGHRLRVTGNDEKATVQIVRRDDPDFTFESVWTLDRAKQAGLVGKDVWKKYPAAMLKARAISECARDACEEALAGVHYTAEELGAEVDEEGNPLRVQATAERADNVTPITTDFDWDGETAKAEAAGDRAKLGELWKLAKVVQPLNEELRQQIAAAGSRVKAADEAREKAAREAADPDGAVEAELVDPEPAPDLNALAVQVFDALIVLALPEHVDQVTAADITGQPVAQVDVSGLLTQDDREALDLEAATLTLADLAGRLRTYTERHSMSPRQATLPV
jgi:hypothetical protein